MRNTEEDITSCMEWIEHYVPAALKPEHVEPEVNKAGIIPLYKKKMLLIKPWAKKKHLGPPPWQLIKGTRMYRSSFGFKDYKKASDIESEQQLEPLLCTALREGMEEAGLKLENIDGIAPLGTHSYRSISTGKEKFMALYALEMKSKTNFDWPDAHHPVTEEMEWFNPNKLSDDVREDAADIIKQVTQTLVQL